MLLVFVGVAEVLFTVSAANAEAAAARYHALLGRIPVRATMHDNTVYGTETRSKTSTTSCVPSPSTPDTGRSRSATPPAGVVRFADLSRVPPAKRAHIPLARTALPANWVAVVEATRPIADVAPAIARAGSHSPSTTACSSASSAPKTSPTPANSPRYQPDRHHNHYLTGTRHPLTTAQPFAKNRCHRTVDAASTPRTGWVGVPPPR